MTDASEKAEVITSVQRRRRWNAAEKMQMVGESLELGATSVPASRAGYRRIAAWARSLSTVAAFGVEGNRSYGSGLARSLREDGHRVLEINRPDRSARRRNGRDDMFDAEAAARAVLASHAAAEPKSGVSAA